MMTDSLLPDVAVQGSLLPQATDIVRVGVKGEFFAECWKSDGDLRWKEHIRNGVTNTGFNLMLDSMFRSNLITPIFYWYIGLIGNTSFSALAAGDTMASHSGWTEDSTHYTPATYTAQVNNVAGYSAGATTMTIDTISQAIPNGTGFTVVGATGTYQVLSSTGGSTPTAITFTPALSGSGPADNAVITFNNARPLWTPAAAATKSISNTTAVNFPINLDSTVIKGIFVTSDPTLGGTSGTLWSTGLFTADQTLFSGDTLKITYQVSLS